MGTSTPSRSGVAWGCIAVTIWDLFALWRRQWVVTLLCVVVGAFGVVQARSLQTVYWGSTSVVVVAPYLKGYLTPLGGDVIPLAGVVEKLVNIDSDAPPAVSPDASIIDRGIYDGVVANVPDYGGQWSENYTNPIIVVQASASDPETVTRRIAAETARIDSILTDLQVDARVPTNARATSLALPPAPVAVESTGVASRALIAMVALGLLGVVIIPFAADRLAAAYRSARRQALVDDDHVPGSNSAGGSPTPRNAAMASTPRRAAAPSP